jgi:hypothetical protein
LILTIGLALLVGCGGGNSEDSGDAGNAPGTTPPAQTTEQEPAPEPEPEPAPAARQTVTVSYKDRGDIGVSYPDDGSITVEQYEYDDLMYFVAYNFVTVQLARLSGDGYHIVLGYKNMSQVFEKYQDWIRYQDTYEDASYGGLDGFSHIDAGYASALIMFPASDTSAQWGRAVALYSDDITEDMDEDTIIEQLSKLLKSEDVQDILNSLEFAEAELTGPANDPSKTGTIDAGYITFACENGWYINAILEGSANLSGDTFYVKKEGAGGTINISGTINQVPIERVERMLASATANAERIDNVTVNGVEYMVLEMDHNGFLDYEYHTSIGAFDENKTGAIMILIQGFTPEEALPLLQTIKIGDSF